MVGDDSCMTHAGMSPSNAQSVDVTVVIVSYNTRDLLLRCLDSLAAAETRASYEVVVVDNASHDASRAALAGRRDITPIFLMDNVGFAAACNLGAKQGRGSHVLLLNPDTEMRPGCIDALLDVLRRHPDAGVVGGRTVSEDGQLDPHSCWGQPSLWSMACFAAGLSTLFAGNRVFDPESLGTWPRNDEREVGVVTGCLLLCSRELWRRLGGMDATYFVYGEDVDFSFRARQLGFRPRITPRAELMHVRGAASTTSVAKWTMILRGKVTFMRSNWPGWRGRLGVAFLLIGALLRAVAVPLRLPVTGPWGRIWHLRDQWREGWEAVPLVPVRAKAVEPES